MAPEKGNFVSLSETVVAWWWGQTASSAHNSPALRLLRAGHQMALLTVQRSKYTDLGRNRSRRCRQLLRQHTANN